MRGPGYEAAKELEERRANTAAQDALDAPTATHSTYDEAYDAAQAASREDPGVIYWIIRHPILDRYGFIKDDAEHVAIAGAHGWLLEAGTQYDPDEQPLTHCEGCDEPQPGVALYEHRQAGSDDAWERVRWCPECREIAATPESVGYGAIAGGDREVRTPLVCPKCEGEGPFRYISTATVLYGFLEPRFGKPDTFLCYGDSTIDYDCMRGERLECHNEPGDGSTCLHEFPIPEWVDIEWT